ncbi:hypothetical protein KV557_24520 [Kitasatospora aureofaciens]|uniref:hypothetical protein n=1 Tax=Kitasatospora aureofaciens TaxID=1894 RepID=UPI001C43E6C8|nr:hypothetical protein [Kitasatospora aureofaciens]MBV6700229.1 hypothetical protein [Kitasatospora aureofaciens]
MRITVHIEDASPEIAHRLLDLLAEHPGALTTESLDPAWTEERALRLLRELPTRAATVIRLAAAGGGWVDAEHLRTADGKGLQGHTAAITQALKRGVRNGWWPEATVKPIEAVYNSEVAGPQRALGYQLADDHVAAVFRAAVTRFDAEADQ